MVHQGRVEIRKPIGGEQRLLRTLAKGASLLGHIALFRNGPRSATALAADAVTLMVIPGTGSIIWCARIPRSPSR